MEQQVNETRKQIFEKIAKFDMEHGICLLINTTYDKQLASVRDRFADYETKDLQAKLDEYLNSIK